MMELIYIIIAFVLGVVFHKGAAALWAKEKGPIENELSSLGTKIENKFEGVVPAPAPVAPVANAPTTPAPGPMAAPPPPASPMPPVTPTPGSPTPGL